MRLVVTVNGFKLNTLARQVASLDFGNYVTVCEGFVAFVGTAANINAQGYPTSIRLLPHNFLLHQLKPIAYIYGTSTTANTHL